MPAGTIPFEIISVTQFPPSSIEENPIKAALTVCGFFKILTVTSVIIPSKPSEPQINPNKSVGKYIKAEEWNDFLEDPNSVVIDTRNEYEIKIGNFAGALNPHTS